LINYPVLSFFTGAGFLDIGFEQQGFQCDWHNEYYEPFREAFEMGMSSLGFEGRSAKIQNPLSLVEIGPSQILNEAFGSQVPEIFGIIGGPPCPDFSVGGKNIGDAGINGKLSEVYVNRILEIRPTFFVFENVPGLLRTNKHRKFLITLLDKLSTSYIIDLKILNALDHGVPQDRERVFIVGFHKNWFRCNYPLSRYKKALADSKFYRQFETKKVNAVLEDCCHWFPWPLNRKYYDAKIRFSWPTETVRFGRVPVVPTNCPPELMVGTYLCDESRYELPNSREFFNPKSPKFHTTREGDVSKKSFKRLHRYRYSPAAAYGNNEVHLHPSLARRLTVREALMLQSVPNSYNLPKQMTLTSKFKMIGNGVPIKLAAALAQALRNVLEGSLYEQI
jgi:DNA (cytosine-5)-methyltransferase 1